eukprot:CAMPEP_0174863846 /NCGR_PEP_ID=MMETSP1114-20130205/57074_1 /TAXON_ID=312471 /ORGANISM="Neobodo designis, Strain CCAP 1951/1" /LENGTH=40 /DNA_ID= /DNA_START= /DNA_END= /DNA_ORIENTATION=
MDAPDARPRQGWGESGVLSRDAEYGSFCVRIGHHGVHVHW